MLVDSCQICLIKAIKWGWGLGLNPVCCQARVSAESVQASPLRVIRVISLGSGCSCSLALPVTVVTIRHL